MVQVVSILLPLWAVQAVRGEATTTTATYARIGDGDALSSIVHVTSNKNESITHIHVLPPSPDETLHRCDDRAALYSTCAADRYCAPLPTANSHQQPNFFFEQVEWLHNSTTSPTTSPTTAPTSHKNHHHDDYYCLHKTMWGGPTHFPDYRDMFALLLTFGCCLLAAMAGIGGGGLILPILLLVTNFTPKEGSVLSNTAVFCNTLGQFLINTYYFGSTTRTSTTKSLLVPATVLMIMPGLIAGGSVAITMEGLVPSTVILVLALMTLLLASAKTFGKARAMRQKEQQQQQQATTNAGRLLGNSASDSPQSSTDSNEEDDNSNNGQGCAREAAAASPDNDALKASALEWGSNPAGTILSSCDPWACAGTLLSSPDDDRSPHRRRRNKHSKTSPQRREQPQRLIDVDHEQNSPILQEPFFGSIRFLAQPTPPNHNNNINNDGNEHQESVSIIDESSWITVQPSTSLDSNDSNNVVHNERRCAASRRRTSNNRNCCCGLGQCCCCVFSRVCTYCANHIIQVLVGLCWVFDATTYLVLHSGKLPPCSPGFFTVMALPAVFAVIFVGLGRRHLNQWLQRRQRQRYRRQQHATNNANTSWFSPPRMMMDGQQPIMSLFGSPSKDSDNSEELEEDPVPAPLETQQDPPMSPQPVPIRPSQWVLFMPLISVVAGLIKAFQDVPPSSDRRESRRRSSNSNDDADDDNEEAALSVPLLSRDAENGMITPQRSNQQPGHPSNGQESGAPMDLEEENIASLLVWWLPLASVLIGLFAALLGIGGGELLGPILLLLLQMDPQDSSATTAIMSMMNAGQNLLHAIFADLMVAPGYAIHLGLAGMIGGSCGRLLAMDIAQRGRVSVIAMSLCGVLSLATALVAWELLSTPVSWKSSAGIC